MLTAILILLPLVLGVAGLGALLYSIIKAPRGCEDPMDGFTRCRDCAFWWHGVCEKGRKP